VALPPCFWVLMPLTTADGRWDWLVQAAVRPGLRGGSRPKNPPQAPERGKNKRAMSMNRQLPNDSKDGLPGTGRRTRKTGGKQGSEPVTPDEHDGRAKEAATASVEAPRQEAPPPVPFHIRQEAPRRLMETSTEALILADQVLNRLLGYSCKGSRKNNECYPRDLRWLAYVLARMETRERNPLRPAGQ